jgi:hypothetical protein
MIPILKTIVASPMLRVMQASMDRLAYLLLSVGCHHAAEHHSRRASELREVPA